MKALSVSCLLGAKKAPVSASSCCSCYCALGSLLFLCENLRGTRSVYMLPTNVFNPRSASQILSLLMRGGQTLFAVTLGLHW